MSQKPLSITNYGTWTEELIDNDYQAYLLTFMFEHISGSERKRLALMSKEVERIYALMLTRIVRRPRSRNALEKMPIWIAAPDFPVWKHAKIALQSVTVNDGLHMHAIALIPPSNRLRQGFRSTMRSNKERFLKAPLIELDVRSITHDPAKATDYALKSLAKKGTDQGDGPMILPRLTSEMPRNDEFHR